MFCFFSLPKGLRNSFFKSLERSTASSFVFQQWQQWRIVLMLGITRAALLYDALLHHRCWDLNRLSHGILVQKKNDQSWLNEGFLVLACVYHLQRIASEWQAQLPEFCARCTLLSSKHSGLPSAENVCMDVPNRLCLEDLATYWANCRTGYLI